MNKKVISLILVVAMLLLSSVVSLAGDGINSSSVNKFVYKVTPDDEEWSDLTSKEEMVNVCKIPKDTIKKMSTDDLVDAVLDYPLLINIYAYNSYDDGLKALAEDSDAYREILNRPDAGEKLLNRLNTQKNKSDSLEDLTLTILLTERKIWNSLNNERKELAKKSFRDSSTTVKTPKGTKVPVKIRGEKLNFWQKQKLDADIRQAFPLATFISGSTTHYNCHSYAWYSSSTYNKKWMNDPTAYMNDGSYTKLENIVMANYGTRMYYANEHSAIVYTYGGPLSHPKYLTVTSKWGQAPLMRHKANYSPYSTSNITLWER